ncbi:MAG: 4-hydroxy-tetrahydrodipicolinate reductase [Candidatus Omnitrophica bacterium]|nr:4-hydroxy-tetrahydrodipicolinate reductase [Candidatus Omnitrophota bacterium]
MIKICVSGCRGKMGQRILALAKNDPQISVSGQFDIGENPEAFIKACDCLVEFTAPHATIEHLALCEKYKKAIVIGTTGLSDAEKGKIRSASAKIPVVFSPNMSVGVNLLFKMVKDVASVFGKDHNISITEAHHVHKKDSPSGTAKELSRIAKEAGATADIPIKAIREGEIVGDHTVIFDSPLDTITISHSAKTRDILAGGALVAAKFITKKPKGLFTMQDVLGI